MKVLGFFLILAAIAGWLFFLRRCPRRTEVKCVPRIPGVIVTPFGAQTLGRPATPVPARTAGDKAGRRWRDQLPHRAAALHGTRAIAR